MDTTHINIINNHSKDEIELNDSYSPDTAVVKMEKFNLDMAQWLSQTQPISSEEKRRIKAMLKNKTLGNQFEVKYILGKTCKHEYIGRWIAKGSIGLQGLSRDIRNALAEDYYWDLDFNNCQVEIMRQMADKNGWIHEKLDEYCEHRDLIFEDIKKSHDLDRDEIKQMFIRILFGGNKRLSDPEWLNNEFYPEVRNIMTNITIKYPDIFKKCEKTKPENAKGSTCAIVLQTEERKCLEALDRILGKNNRNLAVYIHDGGYIEKLKGEKAFPKELIQMCHDYVLEHTGYNLGLSLKTIKTSFKLPNAPDIDPDKSYDAIKEEFEKTHFKLISESCYVCIKKDLIRKSKNDLIESYRHIQYTVPNPKDDRKTMTCPFIPKWINDENIRRYEYIGLYPPPLSVPDDTFNTWDGLYIEKIEIPVRTTQIHNDVQFIFNHIYKLCNEKEDIYEYVLDVIHTLLKFPGKRVNMALLFKACSGFGKEWLFKILKGCIGSKYCHISANVERDILGNFNGILDGKLLIAVDEMSAKVGFKYSENLKTITTQENISVNPKYGKQSEVPNYVHWMYFADRGFPIEVEAQDRRFLAVFATGDPMDKIAIDIFIRIEKDPAVLRAFYDDIIARDDCDNNWAKRRPDSELMTDLKTNSISREYQFILDYCQDFGNAKEVLMSEIYSSYLQFLSLNYSGKSSEGISCISLGLVFKTWNLNGVNRVRSGGRKGTSYLIDPELVFDELKRKNVIPSDYVSKVQHKRLLVTQT